MCILVSGRMVTRTDPRYLMLSGLLMLVGSLLLLSNMSLDTDQQTLAWVNFLQGCGSGLLFLPLTLVVFVTLPQQYRNEGATLFALVRSLSGAAGISLIQAATTTHAAISQSHMVEAIRVDNPIVGMRLPDFDPGQLTSVAGIMGEVQRQAAMVAYVQSFRAILALSVASLPLCLLMRRGGIRPKPEDAAAVVSH